jgi:Tfp pilus assembly protein PilN
VVNALENYFNARRDWLSSLDRTELFTLAQLLVATVDTTTKSPPRRIRGVALNDAERKLIARYHSCMQTVAPAQPSVMS